MAKDNRSEYARLKAKATEQGLSVRAYKEKRKKEIRDREIAAYRKSATGKRHPISRKRRKGVTADEVRDAYHKAFVKPIKKSNQGFLQNLHKYYVDVTGAMTEDEFVKAYPGFSG